MSIGEGLTQMDSLLTPVLQLPVEINKNSEVFIGYRSVNHLYHTDSKTNYFLKTDC